VSVRSTGKTIAVAAAALLAASPAAAQTWVGQRKTPRLSEIIAIDKTGEQGWRYGEEDLAGDGLPKFEQPEQAVDIRTAYATTDATRFWARVYVSDVNAVSSIITAYVFIDADPTQVPATGGPLAAAEINPKLTGDPKILGYDYVVELRGNGTLTQVWTWMPGDNKFLPTVLTMDQSVGEVGKDLDPIRLNGNIHGYLQGAINLDLVGFSAPDVCDANIFVRTVDESAAGVSDLDVGLVSSCDPVDANNDDVPDILVPAGGCTADDQCPGGGICVNSACVIAVPCIVDADCDANLETCSVDGFCLPKGGATCSDNDDCDDLVCVNKICVACSFGGDQCGAGYRCGPSGLCIDVSVSSGSVGASVSAGAGSGGGGGGIPITPGDNVQGGACSCGVVGDGESRGALAALLGLSLSWIGLARRRRRAPRFGGGCSR
jgi:hypothetical protein